MSVVTLYYPLPAALFNPSAHHLTQPSVKHRGLLSADITEDDALDAYEAYLEGFTDIVGLEVVGLFEDDERVFEGGSRRVLYIVGRTPAKPWQYHWRKKIADGAWSPWQAIDADIDSEHVLPVVYQGQLFIFWPRWTVVRDEPVANAPEGTAQLRVNIAWSKLRRGRWTASVQSEVSAAIQRSAPAMFSYSLQEGGVSLERPVIRENDSTGHGAAKSMRLSAGVREGQLDIHVERVIQAPPTAGVYDPDCPPWVARRAATYVTSVGRFVFDGRRGGVVRWDKTLPNYADGFRALLPPATYNEAQRFVGPREWVEEQPTARGLDVFIPLAKPEPDENLTDLNSVNQRLSELPGKLVPLLGSMSTHFKLTPAHQVRQFAGPYPFVVSDEERSYLIHPSLSWPEYQPNGSVPGGSYGRNQFDTSQFFAPLADEDAEGFETNAPDPDYGLPACWPGDELTGMNQSSSPDEANGEETLELEVQMVLDETASSGGYGNQDFLEFAAESAGGLYRFESLHHPFAANWLGTLRVEGIESLFAPENQTDSEPTAFSGYSPTDSVAKPHPTDAVDFTPFGFWSEYHWEVFFHAPLLIAKRLMLAGRHREAQRWLRLVFDPTRGDTSEPAPARYWRFKFLADLTSPPLTELLLLASVSPDDLTDEQSDQLRMLKAQIQEYVQHPFEPHRIARFRPVAYKRQVVMAYIENLIQWGDRLFAMDTLESINEATGLYVTASNLLGDRPLELPRKTEPTPIAWDDVNTSTSNGWAVPVVDLENVLPPIDFGDAPSPSEAPPPTLGLYFCVPFNRSVLTYWDTLEERLFNIRNCRNIAGVKRSLPIFQPPIDPALLVQAAAAGLSIESVLQGEAQGGLPRYRFQVILDRARSLAGAVSQLGSNLLSALEKRDAEELGRLRQGHEETLLELVRDIRDRGIEEAEASRSGLKQSHKSAQARLEYYTRLLNEWDTVQPLSEGITPGVQLKGGPGELERAQAQLTIEASIVRNVAAGARITQGIVSAIPQFQAGTSGVNTEFGGQHLSQILGSIASAIGIGADVLSTQSTIAGMQASWDRRREDWEFQKEQTQLQVSELENQVLGSELRLEMAKLQRRNHDQQMLNAREIATFLNRKFSNHALYGWMAGQLANLHKQSYRMALDMARRAERAYRIELYGKNSYPSTDTTYVRANHFDAGKKGLLAGEKLSLDLQRLEAAWLDRRTREYEVSRTVSLNAIDPAALIALRTSGACTFNVTEATFDYDYPGHFFRRIKSVAVTIPAVTAPHQGVHSTLRLLSDKIRVNDESGSPYPEDLPSGLSSLDSRFVYRFDSSQSIVTSHGREDTGLFNPDHSDPRYLPFEGSGAISEWQLDVPQENNHFDIATVPDVLLHIRYTARDGGSDLADAVRDSLLGAPTRFASLPTPGTVPEAFPRVAFSLRQHFPDEWQSFHYPPESATEQTIGFTLEDDLFPRQEASDELVVEVIQLTVLLLLKPGHGLSVSDTVLLDSSSVTPQTQTPPIAANGGTDTYMAATSDFWDTVSSPAVPQLYFSPTGYSDVLALDVVVESAPHTEANGAGDWAFNIPSASLAGLPASLVDSSGTNDRIKPDMIVDIVILTTYTLNNW